MALAPTDSILRSDWLAGILYAVASLLLIFVLRRFFAPAVLSPVFLAVVLILYGRCSAAPDTFRPLFTGVASALALAALYWLRHSIHLTDAPEWDFLPFFLDGHVAARSLDFYDPAAHRTVLEELDIPFAPSRGFFEEHMVMAFPYPPPTMFLFLPLGYLDFQSAHYLWVFSVFFFFCVDVHLMQRLFLPQDRYTGALLVLVMLLTLPMTARVFAYEQTTFLALALLLLFWKDHELPRAGVWAVLGLLVKPLLGVLLVYLVLRRSWHAISVAIATTLVAGLLTALLFGLPTVMNYFIDNPVARVPAHMYHQPVNHSLLATIVRVLHHDFIPAAPLRNPMFVTITGILTLLSFVVVASLRCSWQHWGIAILVAYAVIVYPQSLNHYSVLLALPVMLILSTFRTSTRAKMIGAFFIAAVFALMELAPIAANAILWIALIMIPILQKAMTIGREPVRS